MGFQRGVGAGSIYWEPLGVGAGGVQGGKFIHRLACKSLLHIYFLNVIQQAICRRYRSLLVVTLTRACRLLMVIFVVELK